MSDAAHDIAPAAAQRSDARVVVLISGRGTNMRAIIEDSRRDNARFGVCQVFSDRAAAAGLHIARDLGVDAQVLSPKGYPDRAAYDRELSNAIEIHDPQLVVLAGFMRILSAEFVTRFEGRIMNIHPSLLPKFTGLNTHRRALEEHEHEHGATVHFVTEGLDEGPAVIQARVPVLPDDDEERLASRVHRVEHEIYPLAVRWFCARRIRYREHAVWFDGRRLDAPLQWPLEPAQG